MSACFYKTHGYAPVHIINKYIKRHGTWIPSYSDDWELGPWSPCSVECGAGYKTRSVKYRRRVNATGQLLYMDERFASGKKPLSRKACTGTHCTKRVQLRFACDDNWNYIHMTDDTYTRIVDDFKYRDSRVGTYVWGGTGFVFDLDVPQNTHRLHFNVMNNNTCKHGGICAYDHTHNKNAVIQWTSVPCGHGRRNTSVWIDLPGWINSDASHINAHLYFDV